jgi:hypothetical protein
MIQFPLKYSAADLDALVRTVDGEARGEPLIGQQGVAWSVVNRVYLWPGAWWGTTLYDVCHHHEQYDCWMPGPDFIHCSTLDASGHEYGGIYTLLYSVLNGMTPDPTGGATMYKVTGTPAEWDGACERLRLKGVILGRQTFFALPPNAK